MKVAVLLEDQYQVLEVWYPYLRLREAGIETVFVGTGKPQYASKEGYPAQAQVARRYTEVTEFVDAMYKKKKLVAAICHAGWVLISAGIVKGRTLTGFSAIKDDLVNAGARYQDAEVVVDGNLITSRTPYDLPAFCREIVRFLKAA